MSLVDIDVVANGLQVSLWEDGDDRRIRTEFVFTKPEQFETWLRRQVWERVELKQWVDLSPSEAVRRHLGAD